MIIIPSDKVLMLATWDSVSKGREKGFLDFEFITWMAWTWQTAAFFLFIALCLTAMVIWEKRVPGGTPRRGALGLDTTRGDSARRTWTSPRPELKPQHVYIRSEVGL